MTGLLFLLASGGGGGGGPAKKTRRSAQNSSLPRKVEKSKADEDGEIPTAPMAGDVDVDLMSEEVIIKADPDEAIVESVDAELQQQQDGDKDSDEENEFGGEKIDPRHFYQDIV